MGRSGVVKRFYLEKYKITKKQITICYLLYRDRWNTRIFLVTKIWYPVKIQFLSFTCEVFTVVMATSVWANRKIASQHLAICLYTLFSFIFAGLKFRENFLGTFRESLISRSRKKIVFAGNLISRNWRLSDFTFSFLQKLYVNQRRCRL